MSKVFVRVVLFLWVFVFCNSCAPDPATKKKTNVAPKVVKKFQTNQKQITAPQIFNLCNAAVFRCYASNGESRSQGSGFFVKRNGIGVSNYHVFEGKENYYIELSNGEMYDIEILASNPKKDYVIFKVLKKGMFSYIPISRRRYVVGQKVYALGSPLDTENTFTSKSLHQIQRRIM